MDPKKIFDTKQTELELDDSSDGDLIEVLYKLHNPATAASVIQPTALKNYFPSFTERMAERWKRLQNDASYRRQWLIISAVTLVVLFMLVQITMPMFRSG